MIGQTFNVEAMPRCPVAGCGVVLSGATQGNLGPGEEDTGPAPGDVTACAYCGTALRFGPGLKLEVLPREVLASLSLEERKVLAAVAMVAAGMSPAEKARARRGE